MAKVALTELQNSQQGMPRLVKGQTTGRKYVEEGRCMRGSDVKLCFSEKERGKVWKDYMERIMNEGNDWDQHVETEAASSIVCVSMDEVQQA